MRPRGDSIPLVTRRSMFEMLPTLKTTLMQDCLLVFFTAMDKEPRTFIYWADYGVRKREEYMSFTDYRVHLWLAEFTNVWLSLHYDNPDVAGAYASELFSGSYTRMKVSLGQPSNRGVFVISDVTFIGLPATRITHLGGWDAQFNGNLEFSCALPNTLTALAGASKTFSANSIVLSMD